MNRVIPEANGRQTFKVVYVVLESQYQASLTGACNRINENQKEIAVECVGYLLEELRNPSTLAQFQKDVESANIFIGSLIFVQELAEKVNDTQHFFFHTLMHIALRSQGRNFRNRKSL